MNTFSQTIAVTALGIRSLPSRLWASLVIVVGMATVVGVLLSMLSFSAGMSETITAAADSRNALVVSRGSQGEGGERIKRDAAVTIMDAPGIVKDVDGKAIVSAEHISNVPVRRKVDHIKAGIPLRAIGAKGILLRPKFRLVAGRMFRPGTSELIVGESASSQFIGLEVGDKVSLPSGAWMIVGKFTTNGDSLESGLLGEIDTVLAALNRDGYGTVIARLQPGAFDGFKAALTTNPTLDVDVYSQSEFYARNAGQIMLFLGGMSYFFCGIMAVGALFGTVNIMYSAVGTRAREIATLRAIGFSGAPVAVSVLAETLFLAVSGCLIGAGIAWSLFSGNQDMLGGSVFRLAVTPGLLGVGLSWAVVIALFGGLFPAIRAARLPVAMSLRRA